MNPLSVEKVVTGGGDTATSNTTFTYIHNLVNDNYYIGRTASKTLKMNNVQTSKEIYTYTNHLLTNITKEGAVGSVQLSEANQYDTFGNVIKKTITAADIQPRIASSVYDVTGRYIEKSIDIEGLETTYIYNKNKGWLMSETNPYGLTTSFGYSPFGMIVSETDYLGNITTFEYKTKSTNLIGSSFVRKETNYADGRKERVTTNAWGNKSSEGYTDIEGNWINTSYNYDSQDRLIKKSEPYSSTASLFTTFEYDDYGRVLKTVLPTGKEIIASYNGLVTTVDDGVKTKVETKNINNEIKKVVDNGETINYNYNPNGTLQSTGYGSNVISFEYDGWGRKTKMTDPSAGTYTYQYNSIGNLLKETTPNGTTTNTYNTAGKILSTNYPGNNVTYNYTADKLVEKIVNVSDHGTYETNIAYDNYKRVIQKEYIIPAFGYFVNTYSFDTFGRTDLETKIAIGSAPSIFQILTVKKVYKNGHLWKLQDDSNNDLKIYNKFNQRGQATDITFGNGLQTQNTYDNYGYLTNTSVNKNNTQQFTFGNTWDVQRGNLTARTNSLFSNGIIETFQYDSFDRLTNFHTSRGSITITEEDISYDGKGRITQAKPGTYNYDAVKQYQLSTVTDINIPGYYQDNPLQQVTYNSRKAPLTIKQQGKENIYFEYDGFNNRTAMYYGNEAANKAAATKIRYYSPEGDMEVDFDKATNKYTLNMYLDGDPYAASILYRNEGTTAGYYYLHRDYLGSILAVTNGTGAVVEKRYFDAWGNALLVQNGQNNNLGKLTFLERGYTGHEHLQGVDLINMNARLYDAKLHRFLAPDNFIQDPTNSQNYNRYGYVMNNPLKYTDESGEFIFTAITAVFNFVKEAFQHGVNFSDYDWHQTRMAWKIDSGMFQGNFGQILSKWVPWGLENSSVGNLVAHAFNLVGNVKDVTYLDGAIAIETTRDKGTAFTLGAYINGPRGFKADYHDHLFAHEYGHYIQGRIFGPLYLPIIGLPSMISGESSSHENRWYEVHASRLGGKYFERHYKDDFDYDAFKNGGSTTYINPRRNSHDQSANPTTGGIIKFWDVASPLLVLIAISLL